MADTDAAHQRIPNPAEEFEDEYERRPFSLLEFLLWIVILGGFGYIAYQVLFLNMLGGEMPALLPAAGDAANNAAAGADAAASNVSDN